MAEIPAFKPKTPITRNYYSLAGVDFTTDSSLVQRNRSPQCVNMYKDYNSSLGQAVETRIGFSTMLELGEAIYGIHFLKYNGLKVLVHAGNKLYYWSAYPSTQSKENMTVIYSNMSETKSTSFTYKNKLYIMDGKKFLYYDGTKVDSVESIAFVPTTSISRTPSGGGTLYQAVNLLQKKRKNSFVADGTSKSYTLDTIGLDNDTVTCTVNDEEKIEGTDFTVNRSTGVITFNTAPSAPATVGQDNVVITFSKTVVDYANRINKCILNCLYDNRVFYSGNPDFPNGLFNSQLDEPSYVSDTSYYLDGSDNVEITSLIRIGDSLVTLKKDDQQDAVVYYHTATEKNDETIYPTKQGLAGIGNISYFGATNFLDEPVFISKRGLESFTKLNLGLERSIEHKSTLVDGKLVNEVNLDRAHLEKWRGYLMCLLNGNIYLADNRQKWQNTSSGITEYEWYFWNNIGTYDSNENFSPATLLKEYNDTLLFGTASGNVCVFMDTQYNDDGRLIYSEWCTPSDDFGSYNHLKTTNKRGGVANLKTLQNSACKLKEKTDKTTEKYITRYNASGFNFNNIDFADFSFTTDEKSFMKYKIKEKKWTQLQLCFYSDEVNRPFGIFSATIEAFVGGYVKSVNK